MQIPEPPGVEKTGSKIIPTSLTRWKVLSAQERRLADYLLRRCWPNGPRGSAGTKTFLPAAGRTSCEVNLCRVFEIALSSGSLRL